MSLPMLVQAGPSRRTLTALSSYACRFTCCRIGVGRALSAINKIVQSAPELGRPSSTPRLSYQPRQRRDELISASTLGLSLTSNHHFSCMPA